MNLSYPTPMPKILASSLLAAALLPWSFAVHAAGPAQGQIHFLVLGPAGQAMPGVTLQGSCQSDDGALFGGQKLVSPWSCTADALGVCRADVRLLPRPDSDRANECRATVPTQITEPGAPAHKGSYFTFFADGADEQDRSLGANLLRLNRAGQRDQRRESATVIRNPRSEQSISGSVNCEISVR